MNNNVTNKIDEKLDELRKQQPSESEFELKNEFEREPENGDTVVFLTKKDKVVRIGKVVSEYNCVIAQDGVTFSNEDVTDMWNLPINRIQETVHYNGLFEPAYEKLVSMNTEEFKTKQVEEYIESRVVRTKGTLSDDKQFLVELFTRNVRNDKIDFKNYKFMMELLFDNPDNEYESGIDLRELRTICYNMFSIMNRISQETYDEIYEKLAEFANVNNSIIE